MRVFLAGASGVVGRPLVRLLVDAGHNVTGTTRSPEKVPFLAALGATPVVVDAYDKAALTAAVVAAKPDVVIHQLTDLPDTVDAQTYPAALARNSRLRVEGTPNLVAAAIAGGAKRVIVQSVCFAYAPADTPRREGDPLDPNPARRALIDGVLALERAATQTPGIEGLALRYGYFYGSGTWNATPQKPAIHVEAAAQAALLAMTRGAPGLYNVAEDDGVVSSEKARRELGFDPAFRMPA